MESVKTYQQVNSKKEIGFGISKMQDIYIKRNGEVDEPHRHDYYTVLLIEKGKGFHKIDFNTYELANHQIYFVAPGQVHQLIEEEKTEGFSMVFSNQFLLENSISLTFIDNLNLFQNYGQSPPLTPEENHFKKIKKFAEEIFKLYTSDATMKLLSIGAFLKLFLIECNTVCALNPIEFEIESASNKIIRSFRKAVDDHYKKEHAITFYAEALSVTSDHLNRTVKSKMGKTAKEYVQARIITEAKRLLYFTDLTNKEIAYELGFEEPANFSAFFKKNTQIAPSSFKKQQVLA